jgi:hypothetical protein
VYTLATKNNPINVAAFTIMIIPKSGDKPFLEGKYDQLEPINASFTELIDWLGYSQVTPH